MAKGALSKEKFYKKILETFEGSFLHDKEIRIPMIENGETIQLKINVVCAKVNIENGNESPINITTIENPTNSIPQTIELTEEEKNNVNTLIEKLGL